MREEGTILLCTAQDEAQAGLLSGILEQAGILYAIRQRGTGPLFGSAAIFGVDILVPAGDHAQAKELADAYFAQTREEGGEAD